MAWQSRSLGILLCMPKIKEPMVTKSTFYFIIRTGKANLMTLLSQVPRLSIQKQKFHLTHFAPPQPLWLRPAGCTHLKFSAALAWTSCKPKAIVGAPTRDELGPGLLSADRG